MKLTVRYFAFIAAALVLAGGCAKSGKTTDKDNLRLVYWNIQNGMWDGQDDDFARFTAWVEA
ncbi:MAG: endonuclease, partial [Bacteroidales bacterium]|nr:endonuclease [Bacteroidales bacterium]